MATTLERMEALSRLTMAAELEEVATLLAVLLALLLAVLLGATELEG